MLPQSSEDDIPRVVELRGEFVMLAADVAKIFGVQTREVVQTITRNPLKLEGRYAFQLTDAEHTTLRSRGVISNPGRGGSRALPWALTQKGVIRLATIMEAPRALEATDQIVDIFAEVVGQIARGEPVQLSAPSRITGTPQNAGQITKLRKKLVDAIEGLLDVTIDAKRGTTLRDELDDAATNAFSHLREMMRTKQLSNEKLEAETVFIIEQTRDLFERRQADLAGARLERELKNLDIVERKIALIERMLDMVDRMEPNAVIGILPQFVNQQTLPPPQDD